MSAPRAYALAIASGLLLTLAFPEIDAAPLAFVALAPFLFALTQTKARSFPLGLVFGIAFFGTVLYWISIVGWLAWGALVLLQAIFVALFAVLYRWIATVSWTRVLGAPLLWVVFEFLRARVPVGGLTWGQLAQGQHNVPWMLRYASLGGGWLVAFAIVLVNALLVEAFIARRRGARYILRFGAAVLVVLALPLVIPTNRATGRPVRVAIVQGDVPGGQETVEKEQAIIASHVRLTEDLTGEHPDLVVWPESSVGLDIDSFPGVGKSVEQAARSVAAPMIVGGNLDLPNGNYIVAAFEISPEGAVVDRYQKTHLVPFGEYVPVRGLFGKLPVVATQVPRDAEPGPEGKLFDVAGGEVAPVISFEGDFGSLVQRRIDLGGRLLVVATNTSTWNYSWASAQHVAFSQVRAAENGVWVVHAALSGISAFVAPDGSVVSSTPLYTATSLVHDVSFADAVTLYARLGDWLPTVCLIGSVVLLAIKKRSATRGA